jgi:DNA repair exonuclease SbcCD ATPase subunit
MPDEKDRFGDKMRDVERAREDLFFQQRDKELVERMRSEKAAEEEAAARASARGRCPKCGHSLEQRTLHEVGVEECPECGGMWLDKGELEVLAERESEGWLGRLLRSRQS